MTQLMGSQSDPLMLPRRLDLTERNEDFASSL